MGTPPQLEQSSSDVVPQPPRLSRSFGQLGIERAHYIALFAPDPAQAADFAVRHMGFFLAHVDDEGRHYLAAHGLDPYSLVYVPGEGQIDHVSYVVEDLSALERAADALQQAGVQYARVDESPLWRHQPAIRFLTPTGVTVELSPGVSIDLPMAEFLVAPRTAPAPLSFDHVILRTTDPIGLREFAIETLGLRESGSIMLPDGTTPLLGFFRCHTLYHCFGTAASTYDGMHHYQFGLKNDRALFAAYEQLAQDPDVEVIWGPVHHGAGQNISFYFKDLMGNVVEYSSEEELVLSDDAYEVLHWSVTSARATDEWGSHPPSEITD